MKAGMRAATRGPPGLEGRRGGGLAEWLVFAALAVLTVLLVYAFPERGCVVLTASWRYFLEVMYVLPAIMVVLGLFKVYATGDKVRRLLGKASGAKGFMLAIGLGALPTGSLFVAFPLAAELVKRGARVANVTAFLFAWACLKLPQELMELQFLGPYFLAARFASTLAVVALLAFLIEKLVGGEVVRHVGCAS